jgi:hypothetical protein
LDFNESWNWGVSDTLAGGNPTVSVDPFQATRCLRMAR